MSQRMNAQRLIKGKKHALATAVALLVAAQGLQAMEFDTGNPDLTVRLDTQLRYNLGVRVGEPTDTFRNEFRVDSVERAFDKGDVVMNRGDALFELDTVYKGDHGFRLSAAAWRDMAYDGNLNTLGTPPQMGEYAKNQSNAYYNKYVRGPGYELLDAFVFTNFSAGGVGVGVNAGKHNLYWVSQCSPRPTAWPTVRALWTASRALQARASRPKNCSCHITRSLRPSS